ncbi:MAG: F-box/WD repeat-containing protein 7 [Amphiamblys sp. WSBS2006]|nr:MAG: F-box/WD repeat-containing protein 7 [Amphiamblys sp. WSBS2006]
MAKEKLSKILAGCTEKELQKLEKMLSMRKEKDVAETIPGELLFLLLGRTHPRTLLKYMQSSDKRKKMVEGVKKVGCVFSDENVLGNSWVQSMSICFGGVLWRRALTNAGWGYRKERRPPGKAFIKAGIDIAEYREDLRRSWVLGLYRRTRATSHNSGIITHTVIARNRIYTSSEDGTIIAWSAEEGHSIGVFEGHDGGVWCFVVLPDILISGSTDTSLRVWNTWSFSCIGEMYGHQSTVRCICVVPAARKENELFVSGSRDNTLRVWNRQRQCCSVLRGHTDSVRVVLCIGSKKVISGSYDSTVRVWDAGAGECLFVLRGHEDRVYSLVSDGGRLVFSGSQDMAVNVWDVEKGELLQRISGHTGTVMFLRVLPSGVLVSGSLDGTVRYWKVDVHNMYREGGSVISRDTVVGSVDANSSFVVVGQSSGLVVWDSVCEKVVQTVDLRAEDMWCVSAAENVFVACYHQNRMSKLEVFFVFESFGSRRLSSCLRPSLPGF